MPSPVTPNQILETVPSPTGNFCEKYFKAFSLPRLIWQLMKYMFKENGTISEDFANDICALDCLGTSGDGDDGDPTVFGRPTNVSASDGSFTDKVRVTWSVVVDAVIYDVYRNESNNSGEAELIASTADNEYDDTSADPGVNYYYWVRARSTTDTSAYSNPDNGYRSESLDAITDLAASRGAYTEQNPFITLEFTAIEGADSYDIYAGDTNNFTEASKIDQDRVPFDNTDRSACDPRPPGDFRPIINKGVNHIIYIHQVPADKFYTKQYFWVVGKSTINGQVVSMSDESNVAEGWAVAFGDGVQPDFGRILLESGTAAETITAGATEVWISFWGSGAAGAGGDANDGGGGGGGPGHGVGKLTGFTSGVSKLRIVSTPEADTVVTPASTNGADAPVSVLQYSADGTFTDTIDLFTAAFATGGVFLNGGLGAGGTGGEMAAHASLIDAEVKFGYDGQAARSGGKGGRAGEPPWRLGSCPEKTINFSGGGANANALAPVLAVGAQGKRGQATLYYRT